MTSRLTYIQSSEPGEADECYYQQACPTEERWSEEIGLTPVDGSARLAVEIAQLEEIVKVHPHWMFLLEYLKGEAT